MGYFDGLTASCFKFGEDGRTIFFPYGIFGKGYTVPNDSKENELRNFMKKYYVVTLPIVIGVGVGIGWLFSFLILPFFLLWSFITLRRKTNGLQVSEERLKFIESLHNSAEAHNTITLWVLFIFSVLFVVGSVFLIAKKPEELFVGLLGFVFFGSGSVVFFKMIKAKSSYRDRE